MCVWVRREYKCTAVSNNKNNVEVCHYRGSVLYIILYIYIGKGFGAYIRYLMAAFLVLM